MPEIINGLVALSFTAMNNGGDVGLPAPGPGDPDHRPAISKPRLRMISTEWRDCGCVRKKQWNAQRTLDPAWLVVDFSLICRDHNQGNLNTILISRAFVITAPEVSLEYRFPQHSTFCGTLTLRDALLFCNSRLFGLRH